MKNNFITIIKYLWGLAIAVFITIYFYTHYDAIINIIHIIPTTNLIIAFCTLFLAKVLLSYISLLSTKYMDVHLSFYKMFTIYNITQLAKYIPGSIWQFIGKASAYSDEGMTYSEIKKSIFLEMLWLLFSAFFIGFILVVSGDILDFNSLFFMIKVYLVYYIFLIIFGVLLLTYYYKRIIVIFYNIKKYHIINIKMLFTLLSIWFLLGLSFYIILVPYLDTSTTSIYINVVGLYTLAYAIGFLVPFAPAGIGIREAVLTLGLSSLISTEEAIVIASLNRIIYIILEVLIVIPLMYNASKK